MEVYFQETGRAGKDGNSGVVILYYSGHDIAKGRNPVDDVMRKLTTRKACKGESFLITLGMKCPSEMFCDYH